jgi:NAD-dependent dihydropyrimidine dehydrogenase PreA subunit
MVDNNNSDNAYHQSLHLSFPSDVSGAPIISNLTRLYDVTFNIMQASITPRKEGFMALEISGSQKNCLQAIEYLREQSITVTGPAQHISRDEDSCMHCGMCLAVCPRGSLFIDREERTVGFNVESCSACGLCTKVCPVNAMVVELENGIM